jgi:hypothetical protein
VQGVVGKLHLPGINVGPLKAAVAAAEALTDLSEATRSVLACAHIILRLRLSVLAGDNNGVRKVSCAGFFLAELIVHASLRSPRLCLMCLPLRRCGTHTTGSW